MAGIANSRPHAAYSAFTHGLIGRWVYLMRTVPDISSFLKPLEDAIRLQLLPSISGHPGCSADEWDLLSLPCCFGGLGLINPTKVSDSQFDASLLITASLKDLIIKPSVCAQLPDVRSVKAQVHLNRRRTFKELAMHVRDHLSSQLQRVVDLNSEPGASSALQMEVTESSQSLCLWGFFYYRPCHGLSTWGLNLCATQSDLRDITAGLFSRVCSDVATMPPLQPLSGEVITPKSVNQQDDARADIHARGFWGRRQSAFLDVRVFHPNAPSYRNSSIPSVYRRHELQKKREYGERVREVEQASFTPLVFSTTGGMGGEALTFYRRLADMLSRHSSTSYSGTLVWIRCTLSFSLLRSATMCIRGTRSILHRSNNASPEMGHIAGPRDF